MGEMTKAMDVVAERAASEKLKPIAPHVGEIVGYVDRPAKGHENWFLVHCVGRSDEHTEAVLKKLKITNYYPMIREFRPLPRKMLSQKQRAAGLVLKRPMLVPLLPRYRIVNVDAGRPDLEDIFAWAGLGGLVCEGRRMITVSQQWIDRLRCRETEGAIPGSTLARLVFEVGEVVRIAGTGPFAGHSATVDEGLDVPIEELDPDTRIRVAMSLLGRNTSFVLPVAEVEKL